MTFPLSLVDICKRARPLTGMGYADAALDTAEHAHQQA